MMNKQADELLHQLLSVARAALEDQGKAITNLIKEEMKQRGFPFDKVTFHAQTTNEGGATTVLYEGTPILQWSTPKVVVNNDGTSFTYSWSIYIPK